MEPSVLFMLLLVSPLAASLVAIVLPSNRYRPLLVPTAGVLHLLLVGYLLRTYGHESTLAAFGNWLVVDPLNKMFLVYISVLFVILTSYLPGYLALRQERDNRWLCACMPASLSIMTLVLLSHHLGLMWVAMEGTTLVTAPSLYFNHNPRSLEATWKYILICSVGIALALLGSFFLAYATLYAGAPSTLLFEDLVEDARLGHLSQEWFHVAFVFLFVGYGTKMGLAPMHTWKPDAYGEAPGVIGAIMAGGMTTCAFLAIVRIYQIAVVAHDEAYLQKMLLAIGLFSMIVAAIYMSRQRDVKRLLAYSSVEHMGMLIFGIGLGNASGAQASLWHVIHNGLTKGVLFLAVANIHRAYGTKSTEDIRGVLRRLPVSGAMLLAGFFAITGSPPFAPFVSEFQMISASFAGGHYVAGSIFIGCMLLVFFGMGASVAAICLGEPNISDERRIGSHDHLSTSLPMLAALVLVVLLGVYNPPEIQALVQAATDALFGQP